MKQFLTVFKFELFGFIKSKIFIILTLLMVLGIGVTLSYPRLTAFLDKNDIGFPGEDELTKIAILNNSDIPTEALTSAFKTAFGEEYDVITVDSKAADSKASKDIEKSVKSGEYDKALLIESDTSFKYIVETASMYDTESQIASQVLLNMHRYIVMSANGLSEEQIGSVLDSNIDCETVVTGKDQTQSFLYTYAVIMILYMVLLLYGQFVATSVAAEKSSRAMEVLVTSSKPLNLLFGKILGSGCAGLLQLSIILFSSYGFYKLNESVVENDIIRAIFAMPISAALYAVLFFVLGFFIYAFIYGASGSLATRTEDLNMLTMPVTVLYIAAFMLVIVSMTSGTVDSTVMQVCTYLPTFAPLVAFVRICMGTISTVEIIISIAVQVVSIGLLGVLCAKIYRAGVLMYGNTPKVKDIFKILKDAKTL